MDTTPRFALPLLAPGQLQKEIWHNESLARLDLLMDGLMAPVALDAPPDPALPGVWYRVGAGASGDWAGQEGKIAALTPAGWTFLDPAEGMRLRDSSAGHDWVFAQGAWAEGRLYAVELRVGGDKVVGARQAAIGDPSGGAVSDEEGRSAIRAILAALRAHGLIG